MGPDPAGPKDFSLSRGMNAAPACAVSRSCEESMPNYEVVCEHEYWPSIVGAAPTSRRRERAKWEASRGIEIVARGRDYPLQKKDNAGVSARSRGGGHCGRAQFFGAVFRVRSGSPSPFTSFSRRWVCLRPHAINHWKRLRRSGGMFVSPRVTKEPAEARGWGDDLRPGFFARRPFSRSGALEAEAFAERRQV